MADSPNLPGSHAWRDGSGKPLPAEFYRFLRDLVGYIAQTDGNSQELADILARIEALEAQTDADIVGLQSVQVLGSLADGEVVLQLRGDESSPGNTYYYGTDGIGDKGFAPISDTVLGADSVVQTVGADGISTFNLDGDDPAPGGLYSYATDQSGAKGWYRPALFESTGLLAWSAPYLSINGSDPTTFDVGAAVVGYTDYSTNPVGPERAYAVYGPTTGNAVPSLANIATWVGIDTPGLTVVMQNTAFTPTQRRTIVQLGAVISNGTQLIAVNTLPVVMRAGINQISDFMMAVGPINNGNLIGPNGANLNINKGAGSVFKEGANFANNPDDPHNLALPALTAANFNYRTSTGVQAATTNTINVTQYESPLGTLATVSNNRFTVQRVYVFTSNLIRIQYGQTEYQTMAEAEAAIATQAFATEANIAENGVLLAFLIVEKNATDLSNPAQAKFIPADKFGGVVGSGGTSITNTDSLPEGSVNLYYTNARARAAVIASTIVNGDTTHSPSGDAVFDALALKADTTALANYLPLTGGTMTGNIVVGVDDYRLSGNTTAGSDTRRITLTPAGAMSATRNAYLLLCGANHATTPNLAQIVAGAGSDMILTAPVGNAVRPANDNGITSGNGAFRWSVVYAATGTINTSDAREKTPVEPLLPNEVAAAQELAGEIGTYQWLSALAEKGDSARRHVGLTVQRVMEIMENHNLNPFEYGFICFDKWEEIPEVWEDFPAEYDADGNIIVEASRVKTQEHTPAGDRYSFRMDELMMFIARGQEERIRRLEALLG